MVSMNPKSAAALAWLALIINGLGLVVTAQEAQLVFAVFAAMLVLAPAIFARGKAQLFAGAALILSLALAVTGYPTFRQSHYMQRLNAGGGLSLASADDVDLCGKRYGACLNFCGAGMRNCLDQLLENEYCTQTYLTCHNQCGAEFERCSGKQSAALLGMNKENTAVYRAVISDEEQYSIWPAGRELPPGWHDAGKTGTQDEVLAWISEKWKEQRPRSQQ